MLAATVCKGRPVMRFGRRRFLGSGTAVAVLGAWPLSKLSLAAGRPRSVYQELGIRPVINCRGTHTVIGASKAWPELHEAMGEAARHFVVLDELQDRVGERLAKLI